MAEIIAISAFGLLGTLAALAVAAHHTFQIELLHQDRDRQDQAR